LDALAYTAIQDEQPGSVRLFVKNRMRSQMTKSAAKTMHKTGSAHGPSLPASAIPDKLYFKIGEVAKLCGVETYVLRFWESEFSQLRPTKSGTGQRLYRKRDVEMALRIRQLLYTEGFTIPGARHALQQERGSGPKSAGAEKQSELPLDVKTTSLKVHKLRTELRAILGLLSTPAGTPRLVTREPRFEPESRLFTD
jgi:DNA-binding transcriptional MerR regulator